MKKETVDAMKNEGLHFCGQVEEVLYSRSGEQRFVVLKEERGYYTYVFQVLVEAEDMAYFHPEKIPALWQEKDIGKSVFASREEALKQLFFEPMYREYF
jgi:hypothetical protein